mmetsp:Transcript_2051/g.7352  ORF Transcript_2051/g.7352 Transcript_2051/m.7352 type:complete len:156 (-) Transcript_2051:157-624(-)
MSVSAQVAFVGATGSATTTVQEPAGQGAERAVAPATEHISLRLAPRRRRQVSFSQDTVDNEHMGRRSSKSCCVFHKPRRFDESDSDDSDVERSTTRRICRMCGIDESEMGEAMTPGPSTGARGGRPGDGSQEGPGDDAARELAHDASRPRPTTTG